MFKEWQMVRYNVPLLTAPFKWTFSLKKKNRSSLFLKTLQGAYGVPPTYNDMVAVPVWLKQADKILAQIHDNYPMCKSRGVKETS